MFETIEDVVAFEIAAGRDVVVAGEEFGVVGAERGGDLRERPDIELALLAFGVGVELGRECALGRDHLARQPGDVLKGALPVQSLAGALMRNR